MKTKTRVLSWVLAICMIAAIIPAAPAQYANAADDVVVYDFIKAANNSGDATLYYFTNSSTTTAGQHVAGVFDNVATYAVTEALGSAPFDIFYAYKSTGCYAGFYKSLGICLYTKPGGVGAEVRMNIKVPESGWYTLNSQVNNGIGTVDSTLRFKLYEGIENTVDSNKTIVESSCNPGLALTTVNFNDGEAIYLDANEKYVVHYASSGAGSKQGNFYIYNLNLTRQYPAITSTATISTAMAIGSSVTTKFGVSTDANAIIREVSSSSSDVSVTPNADGTYTINAVREGFATITVVSDIATNQFNIAVRPEAPTDGSRVYYFSGMVNETATFWKETDGSSSTNSFTFLNADYTTARLSAPWQFFTAYRSSYDYNNRNLIFTPQNIKLVVTGANVYFAPDLKVDVSGWYSLDTDYSVDKIGGKTNVRLYNGSAFISEHVVDIAAEDSFDIKPVYLTGGLNARNAFYLQTSNFPGTITFNSMTLRAEAPELEARSAVKTAYTIGDAAETVTFAVGSMIPSAVTAVSDNAAVTASVSGANVTFTPAAEGTANVTVSATYGDTTVSKVYTITVDKAKAEIPASEIFGKTYAYVKDGTVYFLGGLKGIEGYTEVGFEVAVNGEAAGDIKTSEVYESFVIKGETKAASAWDASYIFITSMSDLEAGDVVTLKPYIANGEAKTYHGDLSLELKI